MVAFALAAAASACSVELPSVGAGAYLAGDTVAGVGSCDGSAEPDCGAPRDLSSCVNQPNGAVCTDNDPYTAQDACAAGICAGVKFADYLVNSLDDAETGSCTATQCTLRDAMLAALASPKAQAPIIAFVVEGTIATKAELPTVSRSLVIDAGAGVAADKAKPRITLDGGKDHRLITHSNGALTLRHLRISNGKSTEGAAVYCTPLATTGLTIEDCTFEGHKSASSGGAVRCDAATAIRRSTFTDNQVTGTTNISNGGAVAVFGASDIRECDFRRNKAGYFGGALAGFDSSKVQISGSAFSDNEATNGGALALYGGGKLFNVTIVGNGGAACAVGGGILSGGNPLELTHVTAVDNTAAKDAQVNAQSMVLRNTLISGPGPMSQCGGTLKSTTATFVSDGSCNAQLQGDAGLGVLGDHGGPTQTMGLQPGALAIDAGDASICGPGTSSETDQRGVSRPQGVACDLGAFEFGPQDCDPGKVAVGGRCVDPSTAEVRIGVEETSLPHAVQLFMTPPGSLLVNGGAETGDFTGWKAIHGGSGWGVFGGLFGKHCFLGSWKISWLLQEVSLAEAGVSALVVDNGLAPPVLAGLLAKSFGQAGIHGKVGKEDEVTLRVAPIDAEGKVGPDLVFSVLECPFHVPLGLHKRVAKIPKGTTKLLFGVASIDTENWEGHFASAIDGMYLSLGDLEVRLANEDDGFGPWQPFKGAISDWKLAPGSGTRKVRVEFRDAATGAMLGQVSDTIEVL